MTQAAAVDPCDLDPVTGMMALEHGLERERRTSPPAVGTELAGALDWERRYTLMRYHTATHVLCGVMFTDYGVRVTGNQLTPEKGRVDLSFEAFDRVGVLATGGGAIMNEQTRDLVHIRGISVWLKADFEVLLRRTRRRSDRPLAERMKELLPQREPVYAQSDVVVQSRDDPHDTIVDEVIEGVAKHLGVAGPSAEPA